MAEVRVRLYGFGLPELERDMARDGFVAVRTRGAVTALTILSGLAERYGEAFRRTVLPDGRHPGVRVFVDSEPVQNPNAPLDSRLTPGSEVSVVVLAAMSGA
jgi:hypothetical protein